MSGAFFFKLHPLSPIAFSGNWVILTWPESYSPHGERVWILGGGHAGGGVVFFVLNFKLHHYLDPAGRDMGEGMGASIAALQVLHEAN